MNAATPNYSLSPEDSIDTPKHSSTDFLFKVIIVGDSCAGKTSIVHRLVVKRILRYLYTLGSIIQLRASAHASI